MICPRCRKESLPGSNYCSGCGKALGSPPGPTKFGSAETYTPPHLAEKILTSRAALEGERKQVTVLFADMKGSLELIADPDPEGARKLFDPVIEIMMDAVHRYEGTVNQVMGDGIMAIFGAPVSHEDHAVRACYAALKMQETIAQLSAEMRRTQGIAIQIRTGLNSGEVIVRSIGNDLRMDYTAVGQTTHLAGRLEQFATPGSILITGDCLRLSEGYVETKPLGPVAFKGLATPIEVHELVAAAPARSRLQAAASRGLTPFVGRRLEMEALHEALRRTTESGGQVLAVVGQAGVGKSRLLHEFIHSPHTRGWTVLESKSISYGRATPYLPLIDFLKGYFKLVERDDTRTIREKVTGRIVLLDQSLQESIPPVLELLGALPEDHPFRELEPVQRQQLTARAITQLMLSESRIQPVAMVFEDLHWNDLQTLGLLRELITHIREARIFLLVSYRPNPAGDAPGDQAHYEKWGDQPHYQQIKLEALAQESLEQLLQVLLGTHAELAPVKQFLIERTEGNPFFIEEIVRSLVETKVLVGKRGQYRLAQTFSSVGVPATVSAVLYARIDRLGEEQKRLLQEAAVIGKDVPFALLQAITEMEEKDLRVRLARLNEAEFLYESRLFPDLEYTFKHSLTRDVAYKSLVEKRVKPLHARVARALARLMAGRLDEHAESIAEHAEKGELWDMAVEYLQRSGEKAFALYANAEAADYYERALGALAKLPVNSHTRQKAVDLTFELRNALIALCELGRIQRFLESIEPVVAGLGDKSRSAHLAAFKCNHHFLAAQQKRAIEVGELGLRLAKEIGDRRLEGELLYRVGQSYHLLGEHRKAIAMVEKGVAASKEQRERHRFELAVMPAVGSRFWLVSMLAECGDFRAGLRHARRAREIAAAAEHPLSEVLGWLAVGHLLRRQGELDDAIDAFERGMALSERYALPMWRLRLVSSLGVAYAYSGRLAEAHDMTRDALAEAERNHIMVDQPILHVHVGEALLRAGRSDVAIVHGLRALDIARAQENKRDEPWAQMLIARSHFASHPSAVDEPILHLESALQTALAAEAMPLAAHCQAMLAALQARAGRKTKAEELATSAARTYAQLDMRPPVLDPLTVGSAAT